MILWTSTNDAGHAWQNKSGIAFLCFDRLWTKCMRSVCDASFVSVDEFRIGTVVRNCGREELKWASCVLQS
jgi:hypothetical protein